MYTKTILVLLKSFPRRRYLDQEQNYALLDSYLYVESRRPSLIFGKYGYLVDLLGVASRGERLTRHRRRP